MPTLGVTGTFGSGKTSFSHYLADLSGGRVIDADGLAHQAIRPEGAAFAQTVEAFGMEILNAQGEIDRAQLAKRAFQDEESIQRLNGIIHPVVIREAREIIENVEDRAVILDVPLLFESGMDGLCEATVALAAPAEMRAERLETKRERRFTAEEMRQRDRYQWPEEKKCQQATYVIRNEGDLSDLKKAAEEVWADFSARFARERETSK